MDVGSWLEGERCTSSLGEQTTSAPPHHPQIPAAISYTMMKIHRRRVALATPSIPAMPHPSPLIQHEPASRGERPIWHRTIGILGGMGPLAHIAFEQRLLCGCARYVGARRDQDYPSWILRSCTQLRDRTAALLSGDLSLRDDLMGGLAWLARSGADFAILTCVTSHAFMQEVGRIGPPMLPLPVLSLLDETLHHIVRRFGSSADVGLLGSTGTVRSRIFQRRAAVLYPSLRIRTVLEAPDGASAQRAIMAVIYGTPERLGLKSVGLRDADRVESAHALVAAAPALGPVSCVILGCTELSILADVLGGSPGFWVDPLDVAAEAALRLSSTPHYTSSNPSSSQNPL